MGLAQSELRAFRMSSSAALRWVARLRELPVNRCWAIGTLCCLLAGCAISRQLDQEEAPSVDLRGALAECRHTHPDQIAQAVARADCIVKATELVRPDLPFPDLLDQENVQRKSLADQVQTGKISMLERNRQMSKLHAKLLAEEQTMLRTGPPTDARDSIATKQWRLSNSEGCASLGGNTENCY